jgi:UDP-N-acetylmuramate dehydrogenase
LALVNRGGASADDIVRLAREIRGGVEEKFGIRLIAEPVFVGFDEEF